jgi:hypothetical protein
MELQILGADRADIDAYHTQPSAFIYSFGVIEIKNIRKN